MDFQCKGQLNLFEMFKPKPKDPDDHICEGCKWRNHSKRILRVDERTGQTWCYTCPGTACANYRNGTPQNLSVHTNAIHNTDKKPYCYNRDFLPDLQFLIPLVEKEFGIKFTKVVRDNRWIDETVAYEYKQGKFKFVLNDSSYNVLGENFGKRFVSFSFIAPQEGKGAPCDNLGEVFRWMESGFERIKKIKEEEKARKEGVEDGEEWQQS